MKRAFFISLYMILTLTVNAQVPSIGLIAYYPFNASLADESGNANNGIGSGVVYGEDRFGNTMSSVLNSGTNVPVLFDGVQPTGSFTLSFWINKSGESKQSFLSSRTICGYSDFLDVRIWESLSFRYLKYDQSRSISVSSLPDSVWHHVVWQVDVVEDSISVFVNGSLYNTLTYSGEDVILPVSFSFNDSPCIHADGTNNYDGYFDDFRVYSRTLSEQEVMALFQEAPVLETPVVTADGPTTICEGNSVLLTASPSSGGTYSTDVSYQWKLNGTEIPGANAQSYSVDKPGSFTVVVSNTSGTSESSAQIVTVNPAPLLISSPDVNICTGGSVLLTGSATSIKLDGVDDYVATDKQFPAVSNTFTMEGWFYPTAAHEIDPESNTGYSGVSGQRYAIYPKWYPTDGGSGAGISVGTNGVSVYEHAANYMPAVLVWEGKITGWTHVAVVYENRIPGLYINGVLVKTGVLGGRAPVHPSGNFGNTRYGGMQGYMDEVRMWSVARTAAEIKNSLRKAISLPQAELIGYWKFDEGMGVYTLEETDVKQATFVNGTNWASPVSEITHTWSAGTKFGPGVIAGAAGTYTVTATYSNGCSATASIKVTALSDPAPVISLSGTGNQIGDTLKATAVSGAIYDWYLNDLRIASTLENTFIATKTGNYKVLVKQNNCSSLSSQVKIVSFITLVQPNGGEKFYFGKNHSISWASSTLSSSYVKLEYSLNNGSTWTLIHSAADNTGSYLWTVPAGTTSPNCLIKISDSADPSVYDISDNNFTIEERKELAVKEILSPISACDLDSVGIVSARIQNLTTAVLDSFVVAYELIGKGISVKETFRQPLQLREEKIVEFTVPLDFPYGDTFDIQVFTLLEEDIEGSNDTATVSIINYPEVSFLLSEDSSICKGKNIVLNVQGGISRKWSTGSTHTSINVSPDTTTSYSIQIWNEYGCVATDSVIVTVLAPDTIPEVIALSHVIFCTGDSVVLTSNVQNSITWSTGVSQDSITVKNSGNYYLDYKYSPFCTIRSGTKQITVHNVPTLIVDGFTSICEGDSTKLIAGNAITHIWSTGDTIKNITVKPTVDSVFKVYMSNSGCSKEDSVEIKMVPDAPPGIVSGMIPEDNAINMYLPVSFSWLPAENASEYNVFIWPAGTTRPTNPTIKRVQGINVRYSSLSYGKTYNWQVVSETSCHSTDGPVQTFTVRTLPNLVLDTIQVLAEPFSGQMIGVSWKVSNIGEGATAVNSKWKDQVFLSVDNTIGASDILLGSVYNTSALQPGGSYNNNTAVKLPEDAIGPYYILVKTNARSPIELETDNSDNLGAKAVDIALSPPPDVQVVEILPPGVNGYAFSGEKVTLNYTVKNVGTGSVKNSYWRDLIQWSTSEVYDPSRMHHVGYTSHWNELLLPGESSVKKIEAKLPENYAGTIYFYITTDDNDGIFEHLEEDNNRTRSQPLNILLTPPPDLQVIGCDFGLPLFSAQSTFSVQYKTVNDGGSATTKRYWRDSLFLSPVPQLNASSILIGTPLNGYYFLQENEVSTITLSKKLKNFNEGYYYLIIKTDVHNLIYEGLNEKNNLYIHEDSILIQNPDLTISAASVSDNRPETGATIHVDWSVANTGGFSLLAEPKIDEVYVSAKNVLDITAVKLGEVKWNNTITTGGNILFGVDITLPISFVEGNHFIHIVTDAEDKIYESDEDNNLFTVPVDIQVAPWADLVPKSITGLPKDVRASIKFPVSFTVKNEGKSAADADVWVDKLYGSISNVWHPDSVVLIAEFPRYLPVLSGESYTVKEEVAFPMLGKFKIGLDSFAYIHTYLYIDSANQVFEYQAKGNNILQGDSVFVRCPPHTNFDLLDAHSNVKDTVNEGGTYTLNWEVQNLGNTTELWNYKLWYDGLYLSEDTIYDKDDDLFIYDWTISGPLGLEEIYSKYQTFKIPYDHFGDYYLLMVVDHTDLIHDADNHSAHSPLQATAGHKCGVVRTASGEPESIHIRRIRKPELQITSFIVPGSAIAGQPVHLEWTVTNNGDKPVTVPFTENFVLAGSLSDRGYTLGTYSHGKELGAGESYTAGKDVFLPVSASGNYFMIMNTDAGKQVYESATGELNNRAYQNISVIQQTPSDLIVSAIQFDNSSTVFVEEIFTLNYVAKNIGEYAAKGWRKDLVYLSKDRTFDSEDILISSKQVKDEILPYQEITKTTQAKIPGIIPGAYYVIILIDGSNNILESEDNNNTSVSQTTVTIQLPQLTIGTPEVIPLENKKDKVYEIKVPADFAGETLIITLDTDAYPALNELYLSKDKVPTTSEADYTYLNANSADQMVLVETLEAGSYFLLVKGNAQDVAKQDVTLLAEILPFEIRTVDANQGGNTGNVTLNIEGAKFEPTMIAKLVMGTRQIFAERLYFSNSTKVYATFNLRGAPLGVYDVVLVKGPEQAIYPQGFEVVEGSYGSSGGSGGDNNQDFSCSISYNEGVGNLLDQELDYPTAVRRNRTVEINIYYRNNGNVDIPIPSRFLLSVSGHPVSASVDGLQDMREDLFLEFKEKNGPPGILRPGAHGVMRAYTRSFTSGSVIELILED